MNPEVRLNEWLTRAVDMYKPNFLLLAAASLIVVLIGSVSLTFLAGPMVAGLCWVALGLLDGRDPGPQIGDVFKGFSYFVQAILFVIVWEIAIIVAFAVLQVIPLLGQLASALVLVAPGTFLMFGPFLIVDKDMDFWTASMESARVVKTNFWPFFGLFTVTSLITVAGAILAGIGMALTAPVQVCALAIAYREVFGESQPPANVES